MTDGGPEHKPVEPPVVGDEESETEVIIDPDEMDLSQFNLGANPRSKSYTLNGLNRIVGIKLNDNNRLFMPLTRIRFDKEKRELIDPRLKKKNEDGETMEPALTAMERKYLEKQAKMSE